MPAITPEFLERFRKPQPAAPAPKPPKPEKAPEDAPKRGRPRKVPDPEPTRWIAHNIASPLDLLLALRKDQKPYQWQAETLYQLAGYDLANLDAPPIQPTAKVPFYYNLVAANGSGKDQIVICAFATWFALAKIRSRVIITSSSHEQLKDQTFKYIKTLCEDVNAFYGRKVFEIVEFHITCNDTGSEIKCFVTDDPGKAEGRHPFDDYPGAEMAVIVNEAKSISDGLFQAFSRFTGYNYWLEISSPGVTAGHFYKRCTMAQHQWPAPIVLGEFYWRRVTAYDCDHLLGKHIDNLKAEYGEHSLIFRSQVLAEFTTLSEASFISSTLFEGYPTPPQRTFGLPTKLGIDLAMSGDEMVCYAFRNGKLYLRTRKAPKGTSLKKHTVVSQVISWIKEFNCAPEDANVDDGGIGKPILDDLEEQGYAVKRVRNEARALNKAFFKNRGAENWARIKRMLEDRILPVIDDDKTREQLCTRNYEVSGIVTKLESKPDMRARGVGSPDRADALALVFDGIPFGTFTEAVKTEGIVLDSPQARFDELHNKMVTKGLTPAEVQELSLLFSSLAHTRQPAQTSLNERKPVEQNSGRYDNYRI